MIRLAWIPLAIGLVAAACGGGETTTTATTVVATHDDRTITLDRTSASAGVVTFRMVNMGTTVHSLALLKTDLPHDKIPADPNDAAKVQLTGLVRESGQIAPGQTKEFSVKLAAGSYVLVCNEPAHYILGMHTPFAVQ